MKKLSALLIFLLSTTAFLFTACSKKSDTTGPGKGPDIILDLYQGFLTTKTGYGVGNLGDTAIIRINHGRTSNSYQIAGTYNEGRPESIDHYWEIIPVGSDGYWNIRSKKDHVYLGFKTEPPSAGYYEWGNHPVSLDTVPSSRNSFVPNKKGNKFYIQPVDDTTVFLHTSPSAQISGPDLRPTTLYFLPGKQEFFFMKPF